MMKVTPFFFYLIIKFQIHSLNTKTKLALVACNSSIWRPRQEGHSFTHHIISVGTDCLDEETSKGVTAVRKNRGEKEE